MTNTNNGKWEEMVEAGALAYWGKKNLDALGSGRKNILRSMDAALRSIGVKELVGIRTALVDAAMPDHPKPGQFSWQLSKLREAYDAALSDNGRG